MGIEQAGESSIVHDASVRTIESGDFKAVFLPCHGMLGASLNYRSVELLRRLENLDSAAVKGSTAGITASLSVG